MFPYDTNSENVKTLCWCSNHTLQYSPDSGRGPLSDGRELMPHHIKTLLKHCTEFEVLMNSKSVELTATVSNTAPKLSPLVDCVVLNVLFSPFLAHLTLVSTWPLSISGWDGSPGSSVMNTHGGRRVESYRRNFIFHRTFGVFSDQFIGARSLSASSSPSW